MPTWYSTCAACPTLLETGAARAVRARSTGAEYLAAQPDVEEMFQDISGYLLKWLPRFAASNRAYVTIAIGCTGGHHRSVYLTERLGRPCRKP
jgi:RNase adaptor protein for sRNA GlmZ degradation